MAAPFPSSLDRPSQPRLGIAELCVINKGQSHCWEIMTVLHTIKTFESNYRVL